MIGFKQFLEEQTTVYHGSPHRFDVFSRKETAHSGEGGAAYGSGLYVSDTRKVAEHYRDFSKSDNSTLYHAKMTADRSKMLHMHKKIEDQPEHIKKVIKKSGYEARPGAEGRHFYHWVRQENGHGASRVEASEAASEYLKQHGIHGIEYHGDIDNKAGTKPTNFVVFNPKHLKIEKRFDKHDSEIKKGA